MKTNYQNKIEENKQFEHKIEKYKMREDKMVEYKMLNKIIAYFKKYKIKFAYKIDDDWFLEEKDTIMTAIKKKIYKRYINNLLNLDNIIKSDIKYQDYSKEMINYNIMENIITLTNIDNIIKILQSKHETFIAEYNCC